MKETLQYHIIWKGIDNQIYTRIYDEDKFYEAYAKFLEIKNREMPVLMQLNIYQNKFSHAIASEGQFKNIGL